MQRPIRVYLCDDVDAMRFLLREVFELEGMEVVGSAADAPAMLAELAAIDPDVIVLDLSMPTMDGLEAIPLVHQAAPRAQIVVFSGYAAAHMAELALRTKASRYVEKGRDLAELCDAVRELAAAA